MNKKLKEKMLKSVKPRNVKWLFGGKFPASYLYIYEGLPDDFILWYEKEELKDQNWHDIIKWGNDEMTHIELMIRMWRYRIAWISKFSSLLRRPFLKKKHIISCMVETKQEYSRFKRVDILDVVKHFGMAANHLYCAERDVFTSCPVLNPGKYEPLNKYYLMSLESLTWLVSTFWQGGSFTDFYTLLKKKLIHSPKE